jgi:hypothetical protein
VKLVMTMLARDEADIVDAQLAFHLNAGVDFVVATDNGSTDGTTEILERYEHDRLLYLIREPGDAILQSEWVTRMARLAAVEFGADWVINTDADEFWWPRSGSLKDVLAAIPERFAVVRGAWRHFLPRPDPDGDPLERMTVRLRRPAFPGDKQTIYHAHQKVAHRARADVVVDDGNHDVTAAGGLAPLRGWYPLEVFHFSFRSRAQFEQKTTRDYEAWLRNPIAEPMLHHELAYEACRSGKLDEYYGAFVVDDGTLEQGLRDGTLALDTRLRDALRTLRGADGRFRLPEAGEAGLSFPRPTVRDDAEFVEEIAPLIEIDGLVRVERRVDALDERVRVLGRAGRRLARR